MKKRDIFLSILLLIFLVTRLLFINGGLNVLEPDEEDYREITQSASRGWPLYWEGKPFFYKFPLFIYLGFFIGKLFPWLIEINPYLHLRLISIASSLGLCILFFEYIKQKTSLNKAFLSTLFLLLNPLILFYSRQGTFEAFFLFWGFLFFYFFEKYKEKLEFKKVLFLSILLALAVLSKHINILLFILPAFYYLQSLLIKKSNKKPILFFALGLLSFIFILLAITPVYFYSKDLVSYQFTGILGQFFIKNPKTFFSIFWEYLKITPLWLSWPIFIGSLLGIILSFKDIKKNLAWLLILIIGFFYINSYYLTPRSFIFIVPYLMIGLVYFVNLLGKSKIGRLVLLFLLGLTAIQAKVAFDSTRHQGVEVLIAKTKQIYEKDKIPIFATFEEDKLSEIARLNIRLLVPEATKSGTVLVDERKTQLMLALNDGGLRQARETFRWIEKNTTPIWEYQDNYPHFPGTKNKNAFRIYIFGQD